MMSQAVESEAVAATLLVRHLPKAIPHDTLSRLFSHYGASYVRPCAGGRLRNCAFVDFKHEALASQAQSQLNSLSELVECFESQEGRMRGQAFVTFPSVELALHALNLVNGYVFKGKPVIIQFGRNPAAGKTS